MDLIQSYKDNDIDIDIDDADLQKPEESDRNAYATTSDHSSPDSSPLRISLPAKSAAPKVDDTTLALTVADSNRALTKPLDPSQHVVAFNPTYDQLWAPIYGPAHPYAKDGIAQGMRNHKLGFVENAAIEPFIFDEQYNTFHKYGYAADPSAAAGNNYIGDLDVLRQNDGISVYNIPQHEQKKRKLEKKKELMEGDEDGKDGDDVDPAEVDNPASEAWLLKNRKSPWAGKKEDLQTELTEEQKKYAEEYAKKKGEEKGGNEKGEFVADKSTFHGKEERDYQGRSWIAPPKDAKATNDHCYIPKRLVHTWSGHTKGVSAIRFFPKYGHLILSAGMDTKVKIWDVFNSGKCMRTYMGHSKAVRDISFCNDGSKFLTAGYDKNIKYWDTETGQVISTFSTGKIPYVVKLNPDEDKQNILLAGMSDKKIVQWDMNTGQITQEYDQHLGAVNTITFVDNNRRFVTSSDDKSLRVWEFGIPVVIKYISEPHMHSMPSISLHPNTNWLAAQSLDNQILIYSTRERFQLNKKKRFAGHIAAGYACQVNFSPDGRFVMSGDGEGKCWFWDWKSCKVFRTLKCHEGVCIGCEWHPLEQSKVATCGWDGLIKYWRLQILSTLEDGLVIETVVIPCQRGRTTVCVSSQVGCGMNCQFCYTARMGLRRNLTTDELVEQAVFARHLLSNEIGSITNVVFMGMGEPLHNIENVIKAIDIMVHEQGLYFSPRKVTVSTSGLVPQLKRFLHESNCALAVSLNATTDEVRNWIMPINRKYNLGLLLENLREELHFKHNYQVLFEYVMLAGINDSIEDAKRLIDLVQGIPCKIDLISFSPHCGSQFKPTKEEKMIEFRNILAEAGCVVFLRPSRGDDQMAACGQLGKPGEIQAPLLRVPAQFQTALEASA